MKINDFIAMLRSSPKRRMTFSKVADLLTDLAEQSTLQDRLVEALKDELTQALNREKVLLDAVELTLKTPWHESWGQPAIDALNKARLNRLNSFGRYYIDRSALGVKNGQ